MPDGTTLVDQTQIIAQIKNFYNNLFKSQDEYLNNVDLDETFCCQRDTLCKICETNLGTPITLEELGQVLKKNEKWKKSRD